MNSERNIINVLELNFLFFISAVPHFDIYMYEKKIATSSISKLPLTTKCK